MSDPNDEDDRDDQDDDGHSQPGGCTHGGLPSSSVDSLAAHLLRRVPLRITPTGDAGRSVTVANGGCTLAAVRKGPR